MIKGREGHYLKLQLRSLTLLGHICSPIVDGKRASQRSYAVHGLKIGGSSRSRANRASSNSSNRQPGRTILKLSLATTISGTTRRIPIALQLLESLCYFFASGLLPGFRCCLIAFIISPSFPHNRLVTETLQLPCERFSREIRPALVSGASHLFLGPCASPPHCARRDGRIDHRPMLMRSLGTGAARPASSDLLCPCSRRRGRTATRPLAGLASLRARSMRRSGMSQIAPRARRCHAEIH